MKNEQIIRKWWDENRESQKELLQEKNFKYQDEQNALKNWNDADFNREKLKKISEIKNIRSYRDDGYSEKENKNFYDEIRFSDEERKFVDDVCTKIQRGPIELRLDGNTIPIICSMAKYKLGNIDDNGTKKRFDFLLNPEKKIPITPNNLKKISKKLGLDENINDEELIKKIDGLNLPDCKCVNSLNQSLLYMRILFDAFKEKNDKNGGNESENNQIGEEKEVVNEYVKLLINNHNIILHGAPGTGKTYLAKEIAKKMIFGDSFDTEKDLTTDEQTQFNEQCGFVQFHQSYDYTDFVEGLRPVNQTGNQIGFERKDGVFKAFCEKALTEDKSNIPFIFIIDEINRGEMSKIFGELFFSIDPGYRGKKGKIKTQYANLQEEPNAFDLALGINKKEAEKDGKKVDKDKYGHFFVPENVYIIGTMNDIDRSVESMDFAMRRRFAFKEITAAQSQESMFGDAEKWEKSTEKNIDGEILNKLKNRMDDLNKEILDEKYHLGQAYQIGGAYFLKFAKYYTGDGNEAEAFNKLWENHIAGVVKEYLRGIDEKNGALFEELKKVALHQHVWVASPPFFC
ncbi:AAA family ATPase [Hallerella succinigenes]|uniref:McrB family protein n=1 Tax=Hallerella succinigenes TaxID=1896222 RepID=UPI002A81E5F7|nr:AAA family ATPase [Hallerella succinigenes]MDY5029073.1 AAA family ATPase [Hallerella succinigenes]